MANEPKMILVVDDIEDWQKSVLLNGRPQSVYLLARTSNPSAADFQGDLAGRTGLSADVLERSQTWPVQGHLGYVVGATYPQELAIARQMAPAANFLIPGVGAQGGDLATAVRHGPDTVAGPVINASRSILYASAKTDFAEAARVAAQNLQEQINRVRESWLRMS